MTKRGPRSSAPTEDDPRLTTASGWSAVAEVVRDSPPHWRSKNPDNDARGGATNSSWGNVASRAGAGGCHTCGEQGHFVSPSCDLLCSRGIEQLGSGMSKWERAKLL